MNKSSLSDGDSSSKDYNALLAENEELNIKLVEMKISTCKLRDDSFPDENVLKPTESGFNRQNGDMDCDTLLAANEKLKMEIIKMKLLEWNSRDKSKDKKKTPLYLFQGAKEPDDNELFLQNIKWLKICEEKVLCGEMPLTKYLKHELASVCIYIYQNGTGCYKSEHGFSDEYLAKLSSVTTPKNIPRKPLDYKWRLWIEKQKLLKVCEERVLNGKMRLPFKLKDELASRGVYIYRNKSGKYGCDRVEKMSEEQLARIEAGLEDSLNISP